MSNSLMKYYSMDLRDLRKLCMNKSLTGITRKSNRQQCINSLTSNKKPKPTKKSRSISKNSHKPSPSHSHSGDLNPIRNKNRNSNNPRSRKRSRRDLEKDEHQSSDTECRTKKRRKTNHPSTMTTPERTPSTKHQYTSDNALRNPRIPQSTQAALNKLNYRAPALLDLLSDDSSTDEDIDITDKHNDDTSSHRLSIVKASSPDSELDDENGNELESESEEDTKPTQTSKIVKIPKYFNKLNHRHSNDVDFDDESSSKSQSESHSESEDEASPIYHRSPSKSQSHSNANTRKSTSDMIASIAKPQYHEHIHKNKNVNVTPNVPMGNKYKTYAQSNNTSPTEAFSISHPPMLPTQNIINEIDNHLNFQDDVNRLTASHSHSHSQSQSRSTSQSQSRSASQSPFIDTVKHITYYMLYIPLKIYAMICFICRHFIASVIIIVMVALLYSPSIKIIKSIEVKDILQSLNLIPTIKYCDTLSDSWNGMDCKACPENAKCVHGEVYCTGDKRFIRGECIYDEQEIAKLEKQMQSSTISLLFNRCGEFECQKYKMYNYFNANDGIIEKGLCDDELSNELAKVLQLDSKSHLFSQVFEKFTKNVKNISIYLADIDYDTEKKCYYSRKSYKSWKCYLSIFLTDNCVILVPLFVVCSVFMIWYCKRVRVRNKILRNRKMALDRKEDVICILKNYQNNSNQRWIPIAQIKAQIMGDMNSKNSRSEWPRVEKIVDKDANIQKSAQMVDGLQKLCWKLSDTALID